MNEVAGGRRIFGRKVLVTAVAGSQRPFVAVLVATEASRHLRAQGLGVLFGDGLVAAHAVSVRGGLVRSVFETEVFACELCAFAHELRPMAAEA
jgi:hypothetical protein